MLDEISWRKTKYDFTFIWNPKIKQNTKQNTPHGDSRLMATRAERQQAGEGGQPVQHSVLRRVGSGGLTHSVVTTLSWVLASH